MIAKKLSELIKTWQVDKKSLERMGKIAHSKHIKDSACLVEKACLGVARA